MNFLDYVNTLEKFDRITITRFKKFIKDSN